MQKNSFFDDLVADLKPVRRRNAKREAFVLSSICAVQLVLFYTLGMARPDIIQAMASLSFKWKLASFGLLALIGASTAIRSFDPQISPRIGLQGLFLITVVSILAGSGIDLFGTYSGGFGARLQWQEGIKCVGEMLVLSLPAMIALTLLMRRGAPTDIHGSVWTTGFAAAAWGGFVFTFACPHDDPLYIVFWYGLGCVAIATAARLVLPSVTRW